MRSTSWNLLLPENMTFFTIIDHLRSSARSSSNFGRERGCVRMGEGKHTADSVVRPREGAAAATAGAALKRARRPPSHARHYQPHWPARYAAWLYIDTLQQFNALGSQYAADSAQ